MSFETIVCDGCGVDFRKRRAERRRQLRKNPSRRFFCSRRCYAASEIRGKPGRNPSGNPERLVAGNRQDRHSCFRYFLRKARNRRWDHDLDLEVLSGIWARQGGRCAISGRHMDLPRNSLEWERRTGDPWKPSLDRIDNGRGYLRDNVRFVCVMANLARGSFTDEQLVEFCRAVVEHRG